MRSSPRLTFAAIVAAVLAASAGSASALTLDFESLATPQGLDSDSYFPDANGGSRVVSGVTFNASDSNDWEIVGSGYVAYGGTNPFADTHGDYALAGNAYSDHADYNGLTLSTTLRLDHLDVAFDDLGTGANSAKSLTITAFGAKGDLASISTDLTSHTLSNLDTASTFGGLSGITGYRFETVANDDLDNAFARAYVIADDLTFAVPVPEPSSLAMLGLGLGALGLRRRRRTNDAAG